MGLLNVGLVAVLQLSMCLPALAAGSIVDLGYAQYQGTVDTGLNTTNFLGIRYAAAPVGALNGMGDSPRFDSFQEIYDGPHLSPHPRCLACNKQHLSLTSATRRG
jgi:hypothetical protein